MTARHVSRGKQAPAPRGRLAWLSLLCICGTSLASDYPPPPGAYRSEPVELPALPDTNSTTDRQVPTDSGVQPHVATSSKMLPLPSAGSNAHAGRYDADNLFGSAPSFAPATQPTQAPQTPDSAFAPAAQALPFAAEPPRSDFAMDFSRSRQAPAHDSDYYLPPTPAYRNGAQGFAAYPPYAPGYPGYPPYPGVGSDYPPGNMMPGYADGYPPVMYGDGGYPGNPSGQGYYPSVPPQPGYAPEDQVWPGYAPDPSPPPRRWSWSQADPTHRTRRKRRSSRCLSRILPHPTRHRAHRPPAV